jgi:hypothetical protein
MKAFAQLVGAREFSNSGRPATSSFDPKFPCFKLRDGCGTLRLAALMASLRIFFRCSRLLAYVSVGAMYFEGVSDWTTLVCPHDTTFFTCQVISCSTLGRVPPTIAGSPSD